MCRREKFTNLKRAHLKIVFFQNTKLIGKWKNFVNLYLIDTTDFHLCISYSKNRYLKKFSLKCCRPKMYTPFESNINLQTQMPITRQHCSITADYIKQDYCGKYIQMHYICYVPFQVKIIFNWNKFFWTNKFLCQFF
jgi:hypothetical protein